MFYNKAKKNDMCGSETLKNKPDFVCQFQHLMKESGSYYVVSANKASSVTLQSPGNGSQRKHTTIL